MTSLWQRISPFGPKAERIKPGVYHYQAPPDAAVPYRLHLRVEPDGSSLMIINAATVLHLNSSATAHAYELVLGIPDAQAASDISSRYRVSRGRALTDHKELKDQILMLAEHPHLDPEVYLGIERTEPFSAETTAPYRLDLALTYATDPDGAQDPTARKRVERELSMDEWKAVLSKAWEAGIPHVTFTGGEPTRRPDLPDLIAHAQALGQVTGLLTEGHRLADVAYLNRLEQAGLDHMLITMLVDDTSSMAGLRAAIASPVFAAVHLTLTPDTADRALGCLAPTQGAWGDGHLAVGHRGGRDDDEGPGRGPRSDGPTGHDADVELTGAVLGHQPDPLRAGNPHRKEPGRPGCTSSRTAMSCRAKALIGSWATCSATPGPISGPRPSTRSLRPLRMRPRAAVPSLPPAGSRCLGAIVRCYDWLGRFPVHTPPTRNGD